MDPVAPSTHPPTAPCHATYYRKRLVVGVAADVLFTFAAPDQTPNRRHGTGIGVIDGDSFADLCTLPQDSSDIIIGMAIDHYDRFMAIVEAQSGAVKLMEVRRAGDLCARAGCRTCVMCSNE